MNEKEREREKKKERERERESERERETESQQEVSKIELLFSLLIKRIMLFNIESNQSF